MAVVKLTIEMNEQGQVSVNGPIPNKVLCYGLLETARDVIKDFNDKQGQQKIIAPTNGDVFSIART